MNEEKYIKKIKTKDGPKQIDFNALANLPTIDASYDESTISLTIDLKDKDGNVISTKTIELPVGAPDLSECVKNTDYATDKEAGIFIVGEGLVMSATSHKLNISPATTAQIEGGTGAQRPITVSNYKYAVKVGITTNTETLTDEEKASARNWLGAIGAKSYATDEVGGVARWLMSFGLRVDQYGRGYICKAEKTEIDEKKQNYKPITPNVLDYAVMSALADCKDTTLWTEERKAKALELLGADNLPDNLTLTDEEQEKWRGMIGVGGAGEKIESADGSYSERTANEVIVSNGQSMGMGQYSILTKEKLTLQREAAGYTIYDKNCIDYSYNGDGATLLFPSNGYETETLATQEWAQKMFNSSGGGFFRHNFIINSDMDGWSMPWSYTIISKRSTAYTSIDQVVTDFKNGTILVMLDFYMDNMRVLEIHDNTPYGIHHGALIAGTKLGQGISYTVSDTVGGF